MSRKNTNWKEQQKNKQRKIDRKISKNHNQKMQNLAAKQTTQKKADEYYDWSDEEYHTDHSAYVSRKWRETGIPPSYGECCYTIGDTSILDYELWKEAEAAEDDYRRYGHY